MGIVAPGSPAELLPGADEATSDEAPGLEGRGPSGQAYQLLSTSSPMTLAYSSWNSWKRNPTTRIR